MKHILMLAGLIMTLTTTVSAGEIYCRYELSGQAHYGLVKEDIIHQLNGAPWDGGKTTGVTVKQEDVRLLHPSEPTVILGCAGTFKEAWETTGKEPFNTIRWFLKPPSAAASPGEDVDIPASMKEILVETELVIVIGKKVKNADVAEAKEAIFGYTVGNDIVGSADSYLEVSGDEKRVEDTILAPTLKIGDKFAPFGPFIYTDVDWKNRERTLVVKHLSGTEDVYKHNTNSLLYPPEKIVSDLSRVLTLNPGDIIFTGTTKALPARVGDEMTVSVEGLCTIHNKVVGPK